MAKGAIQQIGAVEYDGLIIGNYPVADLMTVKVAKNTVLKRGTVLSRKEDGTYEAMAEDGNANAILSDDIDGTTETATAYRSGKFAADKLITGEYTLTAADIEALRAVNIIVADTLKF